MIGQRKDINFIASYHREKTVDRPRLRRRAAYIAPLAGICVVLLAVFAVLQIALAGKNQQLDQLEGYIDRHMPAYEEALALTAQRDTLAQAAEALSRLDLKRNRELLENIIYLGLPLIQRAVFEGSWAQIKKQKIWRHDR